MSDISTCVTEVREAFAKGLTKPSEWRKSQLKALDRLLAENEQAITGALRDDLGKHPSEAYTTEISIVRGEISHTLSHLGRWLAPKPVKPSIAVLPANAYTILEPLGVALIIAPWNYPVQLLLGPLVGAIAAGNSVILKPSELAPRTSTLIATLVPRYLDTRAIRVVEGAVEETTALLEEKFDHIFYTGNGRVARIVMAAAAKNLTPVTLELGGKSPTYVDETADLDAVAKRLAWGKFVNAGQTCVAPDYVLASESIAQELASKVSAAITAMYGTNVQSNDQYGRIVNENHFDRLVGLMDESAGNGAVAHGGSSSRGDLFIEPTVLLGTQRTAPVMGQEIFGPILPIIPVYSVDDAIDFINAGDKPLALYVFTNRKDVRQRFLRDTSSGALGFGLPVAHLAIPDLPFGGVGESGMGAYHGKRSIEIFSHEKSVVSKPMVPDTMALVYPPFSPKKLGIVRRLLG